MGQQGDTSWEVVMRLHAPSTDEVSVMEVPLAFLKQDVIVVYRLQSRGKENNHSREREYRREKRSKER